MVKNRRKDGDHYWVQANVTPLMEAGRPVGYLSVRSRAGRPPIEAAEALYARMRGEKEAGRLVHGLDGGELRRRDWRGRLGGALGVFRLERGAAAKPRPDAVALRRAARLGSS